MFLSLKILIDNIIDAYSYQKEYIDNIINILNTDKLDLYYEVIKNIRQIKVIQQNNEVGNFTIKGNFNETLSMEIYLDDNLQGFGLSKLMIGMMCYYIEKENIRTDQFFAIDGDGSDGFWDNIGMVFNNRCGYDRISTKYTQLRETFGYEKIITFSDLSYWSLKRIYGDGIRY